MRSPSSLLVAAFVCLASLTDAQSPRPQATRAQSGKATPQPSAQPTPTASPGPLRPEFRPAVFASGPDSLVNRIDVNSLLSKGQQGGGVQFAVVVNTDGSTREFRTYRALPNSEALQNEVEAELPKAKFAPAVYHHQLVMVLLYGTALFNPGETPHLHIMLNQDPNEIQRATDFIGPQPVIGADSLFSGFHPPAGIPVALTGIVSVAIRVDAKGVLQHVDVTNEDPPLLGLATCAANDFDGAKFVPAFRDGDVTDSESVMFIAYQTPLNDTPAGLELAQPTPVEPQQ